jgi:hypothetical protein
MTLLSRQSISAPLCTTQRSVQYLPRFPGGDTALHRSRSPVLDVEPSAVDVQGHQATLDCMTSPRESIISVYCQALPTSRGWSRSR